jgi:putative membrane protein
MIDPAAPTPSGGWHHRMVTSDDQAERSVDVPDRSASIRDHLANERTLLAWQRTALALLGLGFLVDRFAFEGTGTSIAGTILGLGLILVGALASVAGTYRYLRTERDIDRATYRPASLAHLLLTGLLVVGAVLLVVLLLLEPN